MDGKHIRSEIYDVRNPDPQKRERVKDDEIARRMADKEDVYLDRGKHGQGEYLSEIKGERLFRQIGIEIPREDVPPAAMNALRAFLENPKYLGRNFDDPNKKDSHVEFRAINFGDGKLRILLRYDELLAPGRKGRRGWQISVDLLRLEVVGDVHVDKEVIVPRNQYPDYLATRPHRPVQTD